MILLCHQTLNSCTNPFYHSVTSEKILHNNISLSVLLEVKKSLVSQIRPKGSFRAQPPWHSHVITVVPMYQILLALLKFCHNNTYQKKTQRKRTGASAEEYNSGKNVWKFPWLFLFSKKNMKRSKSHPAVSWDRNNYHHLIVNCPATSDTLSAERCIYLFTVTEPVGLPRKCFNSAGTGQLQSLEVLKSHESWQEFSSRSGTVIPCTFPSKKSFVTGR